MDILLIAGLWLTPDAWEPVLPGLAARGHRGVPVALPGQGDGRADATYADQVAAVVAAVDAADRPVVVGHSAACTLAWAAADARPEAVRATALVGGFPANDGDRYADFLEPVDGLVPFPGWERFEGPDAADLDPAARAALEATMVPVPAGVTRGTVHWGDPRRHDVPTVLVCPEFSPEQAQEWVASGDSAELAAAGHLSYVDVDSGHWPMTSCPEELARVLADVADGLG